MLDQQNRMDAELARRYRWFCEIGWKKPVLNDPRIILGKATPEDANQLIVDGMRRWPGQESPTTPPVLPPRRAA